MTSKPTKSVLITGCSAGGVGAALALTLAQRQSPSPKYLVFATARNPAKIPSSLSSLSNVICLPLDVTSDSSVASTADSVRTHLKERGLKGLDVLVNNAGLGWWFPILDVPMEDAKQIFETNFFGVVRMVQAFGRDVVEAKGCIVNVSSIAGEEGCWEPFKSIYRASKAALTAASEAWRLELEPLGVRVLTIAMGNVSSQFFSAYGGEIQPLPENSYYTPIKKHLDAAMVSPPEGSFKTNTDVFAEKVVREIERGTKGKVWLGGYSTLARVFGWLLPVWVCDIYLRMRTPGAFEVLRESRKGL